MASRFLSLEADDPVKGLKTLIVSSAFCTFLCFLASLTVAYFLHNVRLFLSPYTAC